MTWELVGQIAVLAVVATVAVSATARSIIEARTASRCTVIAYRQTGLVLEGDGEGEPLPLPPFDPATERTGRAVTRVLRAPDRPSPTHGDT